MFIYSFKTFCFYLTVSPYWIRTEKVQRLHVSPRGFVALVKTHSRTAYWYSGDCGEYTLQMGEQRRSPYLAQTPPDLGLNGRVHLFLVYGHRDKFIENRRNSLPFGIVNLFAETNQIWQPGSHIFQTKVFQFNTWNEITAVSQKPSKGLVRGRILRKNLKIWCLNKA